MNTPLKILFNFPSKGRPGRFINCLKNLRENIDDLTNCCFLFKIENDIYEKIYHDAIWDYKINYNFIILEWTFGNKINAINNDINNTFNSTNTENWDIVISWSDDMLAVKKGFDNDIRDYFQVHFPDGDGCLGLWDGYRPDDLITLPVLGRKYYQRFNYIYHPDYKSVYCDNEMTEVAKKLGKFVFIKYPQLISHEHCANNNEIPKDEGYILTESFYNEDFKTYQRRKDLNFGLK